MNVYGYNRQRFIELGVNDDNVNESKDYYVSILPTGGPKGVPIFNQQHTNAYTIVFDDVLESGKFWGKDINRYYDAVAITEEQAKDLHYFLLSIPEDANVHIHCVYGKSRTGAVAKYLRDYRNAVVHDIELEYVNERVYELLHREHN
jgi:predicted protein tyrosine phosphatase